MISSKLEKIIIVLLWYAFLLIFRFALPISDPPNDIDKCVVIFCSILTTAVICFTYFFCRDKYVLNKINRLLEANRLEEATRYIDKCLKKQKKSQTMYMYKLYVAAMCGDITEFERMLFALPRLKKHQKLVNMDFLNGLICIIDFLKTGSSSAVNSKKEFWKDITVLLSERDYRRSLLPLQDMYNSKYSLIKTVIAFKLFIVYSELNDIEKSNYYYSEALKNSPSPEVSHYIEGAKIQIEN